MLPTSAGLEPYGNTKWLLVGIHPAIRSAQCAPSGSPPRKLRRNGRNKVYTDFKKEKRKKTKKKKKKKKKKTISLPNRESHSEIGL